MFSVFRNTIIFVYFYIFPKSSILWKWFLLRSLELSFQVMFDIDQQNKSHLLNHQTQMVKFSLTFSKNMRTIALIHNLKASQFPQVEKSVIFSHNSFSSHDFLGFPVFISFLFFFLIISVGQGTQHIFYLRIQRRIGEPFDLSRKVFVQICVRHFCILFGKFFQYLLLFCCHYIPFSTRSSSSTFLILQILFCDWRL